MADDIALMAHLMRRAGFGAARDELERRGDAGYDETVEELLHPSDPGNLPDDLIRRYHVDLAEMRLPVPTAANWLYRMITTRCPLEEKIALFWHGLFASNFADVQQMTMLHEQIDMFRRRGLGSFRDLLIQLSRDTAMGKMLDNVDNHKGAVNENYGRELLELFSMGIGNYTEDDVKEASRAFTGWTRENAEYAQFWPYGRVAWSFKYREDDHDDDEKSFLGERGRFNGEDIVDVIVARDATARFIGRRLFQFFAADEIDEEGERVVEEMIVSYFESEYEIRAMLRTLFLSDYFRSERARFARIKGPVEFVVGAVRTAGSYTTPSLGIRGLVAQAGFMGQIPLQPPSVEGWHEGVEWVDSGTLIERVNFVASELGDVGRPGVRAIIDRLADENGGAFTPEALVNRCLDLIGPIEVSDETHDVLVGYASAKGVLSLRDRDRGGDAEQRVGDMLRLIASTREYQRA